MTSADDKYVSRGRQLMLHDDSDMMRELKKANRNKIGHPFEYADSLFAGIATIKAMTNLSYRCLQGLAGEMLQYAGETAPDNTAIYRS